MRRSNAERIVAHWAVPCAWPIGVAARDVCLEAVSHGGDVRLLASLPAPARRFVVGALTPRLERWRFVSSSLLDELLRALEGGTRRAVERVAVLAPAALEMPDVRDAVARRRASFGGRRVAVSVGRLVPSKRVDRAIERIASARDVDTLVVVGDGPERARLEQLAKARGIDARFVGVVARPDALAWIGAATFVLHASEAEGASTVLREAQVLGTPVEIIPARCVRVVRP
jgi:glycosyltransferase involved in cell wall biosynthesis